MSEKRAEARLDKWLWAARIFKTRTLAADACKNGRVTINGAQAKPSRMVGAGDEVGVKKSPVTYTFRVLQPIEKRVGAKVLPEILENITAPEQYEILEMSKISGLWTVREGRAGPRRKTVGHWTILTLPFFWMRISILTWKTEFPADKTTFFPEGIFHGACGSAMHAKNVPAKKVCRKFF